MKNNANVLNKKLMQRRNKKKLMQRRHKQKLMQKRHKQRKMDWIFIRLIRQIRRQSMLTTLLFRACRILLREPPNQRLSIGTLPKRLNAL